MFTRIIFIPLFLLANASFLAAQKYHLQGVVVSGNSSTPVPNVVVSVGNSGTRTKTDSQGKFSFEVSSTLPVKKSLRQMRVSWNNHTRVLDLKNAPAVNEILLSKLDGKVVCRQSVSLDQRALKIPFISHGIYLLQLKKDKEVLFTSKLSSYSKTISFNILNSSIKTGAVELQSPILFRHDDYFPLELSIFDPSQEIVIILSKDPRSYIFDQTQVHSYYFTVTKDDSMKMEQYAVGEEYVPATFKFDDSTYGQVGFRFKGSGYSLPNCFGEDSIGVRQTQKPECLKISFKVKFDEYDTTMKFYSMKALNLHALSADGTKMHDMLSYGLFRDMGVYAPRTSYVKIYLNGVFQGLFLAVEKIDGRFTKSRWPGNGDGNLYKEAWPKYTSFDTYKKALETNEDGPLLNVSKMVNFAKVIKSSTPETFLMNVDTFIDFDYLIRYLVVDRAINNWDGITAFYCDEGASSGTNHNFYIYEEKRKSGSGKIWLIPWDMDNTFWHADPYIDDNEIPNWNVAPEKCSAMGIWNNNGWVVPSNCDKLLNLTAATLWNKFVQMSDEFIKSINVPDSLLSKIDRYSHLIDSIVAKDPVINYDSWVYEVSSLKKDIPYLCSKFDNYVHGRNQTYSDTSDYSTPFPGTGKLLTTCTNNFELDSLQMEDISYTYKSEGSTFELFLNKEQPLWGTADLKAVFVYNQIEDDASYSEWGGFGIPFSETAGLSKLKEIKINLTSDVPRGLRVFLTSPVYEEFDADVEYGWEISITPTNKIYTLKMDNIRYPSWANNTPDILDSVLIKVVAFAFSPSPLFDSNGELRVVPDSGCMKIDNIKFVFKPTANETPVGD